MAIQPILEFDSVSKVFTAGGQDVYASARHLALDHAAGDGDRDGPVRRRQDDVPHNRRCADAPHERSSDHLRHRHHRARREQPPGVRQEKIGFIFQNFNLLDALTALQNVELVMNARGVSGKGARNRASELLRIVGVSDRQRHTPSMLSGGQKQRVAIARAIANNPDLILADEPTANLDSKRGHEIMQLLRMVARELGRTVVAVSHDLRLREMADRVLWLEDGQFQEMPAQAATAAPS